MPGGCGLAGNWKIGTNGVPIPFKQTTSNRERSQYLYLYLYLFLILLLSILILLTRQILLLAIPQHSRQRRQILPLPIWPLTGPPALRAGRVPNPPGRT